jgi:hypothetical protein
MELLTMSRDEKDEEMIYALTANERDVLLRGLDELPDTMPPRAVWHRIREQAEAEGLMSRPRSRQPSTWYMGGSLAAAVLLAAVILPMQIETPSIGTEPTTFPVVPPIAQTTNDVNVLQALMVESRQLETDLRSLPGEPRVVRAGTQATILDFEDRIAAIDYQLSDPEVQMTPDEQEIFWRERVRLMKSLVRLRYAQAQRTAF